MRKAASYFLLVLLLPFGVNAQIITTIVGTGVAGYTGDGGTATNAKLNRPDMVKFDAMGDMYIAEEFNHVVRKITPSGVISTFAGNGTPGYSGDGGPATNALLKAPTDIVFDASGNMYVSEFGNGTIRKITPSGIISTFAGIGVNGYNGDNILATTAKLYDPLGLVFDNTGNLFFSCNGDYRIRKINTSGIITTIAGTGVAGYGGDGGPATAAQFRLVGYLAIGPTGDLYIPDYPNRRVRKINSSGIISTVIGDGTATSTGDGGPASNATLISPCAILFDEDGNMYISDKLAYKIRKVNTLGIISTIAGNGMVGYGGDGGSPLLAQFDDFLNCSAVDAGGNLYIGDPENNRIRKITYTSTVNDINTATIHADIYPNPASNEVMIKTDVAIEDVAIVNILGQVETSHKPSLHGKEAALNIATLQSGIYFVKVNGVYAGRFVKE